MEMRTVSRGLYSIRRKAMASPGILVLAILYQLIGQLSGAQYYLFRTTHASWEEAQATCVRHGRILARIKSTEDERWVRNLRPYISGDFWIGLRKGNDSDNYFWLDNEMTTYTNWAQGFPGVHVGLDCTRVRSGGFEWVTYNCSEPLSFLCEDVYFKRSPRLSESTKVKGLMMGFAAIGGMLILACLLLQLPCCRVRVGEKISHIGLGMKAGQKKERF